MASPPTPALCSTNEPLSGERLIGRDGEVRALVEGLVRGEHQVLVGPPKAGKTSVAGAAVAALEADGWRGVTVELSHTSRVADCIDRLVPVDKARADPTGLGEALKSLQGAAEAEDRRVVLVIDDFQEIATTQLFGKPEEVAAELRAALEGAPGITCLLAGSVQYVMRGLFVSEEGAFHQFGSVTNLPLISAAAWREGLRSRFSGRGCDISDAALDRVIELGEGHARTTMLIAQGACGAAVAGERGTIDVGLVDEGLRAALATDKAVNESELARTRTLGKHTLATALRVARGESAYKHLPPAVARQTLRSLELGGVVDHPRSREWRIANPLFQRYLLGLTDGAGSTTGTERSPEGSADIAAEAAKEVTAESASVAPETEKSAEDGEAPSAEEADQPAIPPEAEPAVPAEASADGDRSALDHAQLSFRHPHPGEADAVGELVAKVVASDGNGHASASGGRRAAAAEEWSGRRFGSFVSRTVSRAPNRYWQLEANGQPVGGLVLYRPRALLGPRTSVGIDPLVQLAVLCGVVLLTLTGIGLLVAKEAWNWGGLGGLLFGCFLGCLLLAAPLVWAVLGRARASWIARRHEGVVFEGLWSAPGAMPAVFEALAAELPGTFLTAHAEKRDLTPAYRAVGFRTSPGRVLTGVLDPGSTPSVRPETPRRAAHPRAHAGSGRGGRQA